VTRETLTTKIRERKGIWVRVKAEIELYQIAISTIEGHRALMGDEATDSILACHQAALARLQEDERARCAFHTSQRRGGNCNNHDDSGRSAADRQGIVGGRDPGAQRQQAGSGEDHRGAGRRRAAQGRNLGENYCGGSNGRQPEISISSNTEQQPSR
jgi:hypothetical protein